jgi:hypothetical protein
LPYPESPIQRGRDGADADIPIRRDEDGRRAAFAAPALELFSKNILQHDLIEAEVRNQLLKLAVLFFKLAQSA